MSYNHEYPYVDPNRSNADWLLNKVKEFGATLDSWKATIEELAEAIKEIDTINGRLDALEEATSDLDNIRERVTSLEESVRMLFTRDEELEQEIKNITVNYDLVLGEIERLSKLFVTYYELAQQYTDDEVNKLRIEYLASYYRLEREIAELRALRPMELINPIRGTVHTLQKSYDYAYADMRDDCIDVAKFAELGMSANTFEAYELSNIEFSLHSRSIFKWDYVTAPVSGLYKSVSHALSEILNFIIGAFTSNEFDALDLTSDAFDALDYSCLDYLLANDANRGLTVSEFSDIIKTGGSNILRTE